MNSPKMGHSRVYKGAVLCCATLSAEMIGLELTLRVKVNCIKSLFLILTTLFQNV